jgi:hypothetical protein
MGDQKKSSGGGGSSIADVVAANRGGSKSSDGPKYGGTSRTPFKATSSSWQGQIRTEMKQFLRRLGPQPGLQDMTLATQFDNDWDDFMRAISRFAHTNFQPQHSGQNSEDISDFERSGGNPTNVSGPTYNGKINPLDKDGLQYIFEQGVIWAANRYGADGKSVARALGQGGGGGGGRRGPSAQDIRNQFDVEELTDFVTTIGRGLLVEEIPNARQIATQYIEEQVRHKGQKEIDFQTFVTTRLEKTGRYKQLYRNKPDGMDPATYLAPYVAAAQQALGGGTDTNEYGDVVAGGAALGANAQSFAARLRRTDKMRNTAGFIGSVEGRMSRLSDVLRG